MACRSLKVSRVQMVMQGLQIMEEQRSFEGLMVRGCWLTVDALTKETAFVATCCSVATAEFESPSIGQVCNSNAISLCTYPTLQVPAACTSMLLSQVSKEVDHPRTRLCPSQILTSSWMFCAAFLVLGSYIDMAPH